MNYFDEPLVLPPSDGCGVSNLTEPVIISLRHLDQGTDRTAAFWDFDILGGYGGWRAEGCQLILQEPNFTTVSCQHLSNTAVLMVGGRRGMVLWSITFLFSSWLCHINFWQILFQQSKKHHFPFYMHFLKILRAFFRTLYMPNGMQLPLLPT